MGNGIIVNSELLVKNMREAAERIGNHFPQSTDQSNVVSVALKCVAQVIEDSIEEDSEPWPGVKPPVSDLVNALNGCLKAMVMQQNRETESFHLSQPNARYIWDEAKSNARAIIEKCGLEAYQD